MGGELVTTSPSPVKPKTLSEQFEEALPYYMAIGMSYDEFWNGDCELTKHYRNAHEVRLKQRNYEMWLQGLYIHDAVGVVVANALRKKGAKAQKYTESPYPVTPMEQREVKRREELKRYEGSKAKMKLVMEAINARFRKTEVKKDVHG